MNLIGHIIVWYLLIVNSYASVHITRHVWLRGHAHAVDGYVEVFSPPSRQKF